MDNKLKEILLSMTSSDLRSLGSQVFDLANRREREENVPLWQVSVNNRIAIKFYRMEDHKAAVDCLCDAIGQEASRYPGRPINAQVKLETILKGGERTYLEDWEEPDFSN